MWSDGRAARHSSAKAATAVRIRFRPLKGALQVIVAHFFVSEDKFTPFFTPSSANAESKYLKKLSLQQYNSEINFIYLHLEFDISHIRNKMLLNSSHNFWWWRSGLMVVGEGLVYQNND